MAKNNVNIKLEADPKPAETGINAVTSSLNKLAKEVQKSPVTKLSKSFVALGNSFKMATSAIRAAANQLKEFSDVAKVQINAEKQLEVAAKNNPYLDGSSVRQLEDYASHLQSISTVGDEQLLPMMAQLASAGRTQNEIQDIMSAALDLSASGMMSLDSAVSALNKTFSGSAGTLGNQISKIKELTKEQLKNGEAIKIIQEQYKGMAEETAKATGSVEQLKNAAGDVKEELGMVFVDALTPMRRFFTEAFSKLSSFLSNARKASVDAEQAVAAWNGLLNGEYTLDNLQTVMTASEKEIDKVTAKINALKKEYEGLTERKKTGSKGKKLQDQIDELEAKKIEWENLQDELEPEIAARHLENLQALVQEAAQVESSAARQQILTQAQTYETLLKNSKDYKTAIVKIKQSITEAELNEQMAEVVAAEEAYEKKIAACKEEIAQREKLGETISDEDKILKEISVREQGLFDLVNRFDFETWDTQSIKNYAAELQSLFEKLKEIQDKTEDGTKKFQDLLAGLTDKQRQAVQDWYAEAKDTSLEFLESQRDTLNALKDQYKETAPELAEIIQNALDNVNAAISDAVTAKVTEVFDNIQSITTQVADMMNSVTSTLSDRIEDERQEELTDISEQYTDGLISYEEYCEKKKEIEKKAAMEQYKIQLWEWTTNLAVATANIAQGVSKAIAQGGTMGIVTGALVGAAGAVQLATMIANKPKAPSFATGGIVPGSSYSGDNVRANVNSGEMILTAAQQRNLWDMANGGGGGGMTVNMPVKIENNASDAVSATAQMTPEGLTVLINKVVNAQMQKGTYTRSMQIAQSRAEGISYL